MENLLDIYYFESDGIKRRDNVYRGGNAPINTRFFALFEILTRELIDNTRVGHRQVVQHIISSQLFLSRNMEI